MGEQQRYLFQSNSHMSVRLVRPLLVARLLLLHAQNARTAVQAGLKRDELLHTRRYARTHNLSYTIAHS